MRTHLLLLGLAVVCAASSAAAQETPAARSSAAAPSAIVHQKSATTATVLAVLAPGVGHMYTGETGKGVALFGIGVGSMIFGSYMWQRGVTHDIVNCESLDCAAEGTVKQAGWAYAGTAIYLATWVYGLADAGSSAHRVNERAARRTVSFAGATLEPVAGPTPQGFAVGMRVGLGR